MPSTKPVTVVHFSPATVGSGTAMRNPGSASAISVAAMSWASNSAALNAGFAIFNTPTIAPSSVFTVKFLSCWLPNDLAWARNP